MNIEYAITQNDCFNLSFNVMFKRSVGEDLFSYFEKKKKFERRNWEIGYDYYSTTTILELING